MKNLQAVITVAVIFLFRPTGLLSQDRNLFDYGYPEITQYTPQDYQAHSQTWGITQDSKGRMYFGSSDGVLQYDGVTEVHAISGSLVHIIVRLSLISLS